MKKIKVLIVGSDTSVKGGISTVIKQYLDNDFERTDIKYLSSYIQGSNVKKALFFLKSYFVYVKKTLMNEFDIAHVHMSYNGSFYRKLLILLMSKLFNKKVIIHLHGSEFEDFYYNSNKLIKSIIRFLLRNCDAFLVLGDNWKKKIEEIEPKSNVYILKNCVSIPKFKVKLDNNRFNILFLGVLIKRKGIYDLLEVIKILNENKLIEKYNLNFIIGGTGKEESNIKELIKEYNIGDYVNMVGWIDKLNKEELLKKTQLFILPSYNEGLPMALLEAMSYGIPAISTDVGSVNEVIDNEENGYLIKPNNKYSLYNRIIDIVEDEGKWKVFSEDSKKKISECFNEKIYFQNIEEIYYRIFDK